MEHLGRASHARGHLKTQSLGIALVLLVVCAPIVCNAEPPPVKHFTGFARFQSMRISPDGKFLAVTRRTDETEILTILHWPDLKLSGQAHFGSLVDIDSVHWANESRLLISPARRYPGYISYKAPSGEILGINANGRNVDILFGQYAGKEQIGTYIEQTKSIRSAAELLDVLPDRGNEVLIQTYGYGMEGEYNAAYRMDIRDGRLRRLVVAPLRNATFITDLERRVALAYGQARFGNTQVFHRPGDGEWKLVVDSEPGSAYLRPIAPYDANGRFLVLDNRDASTNGVFAWNPADGKQELLYRHEHVDVWPLGVDPSGKVWGFRYFDHFPGYWYVDPEHPLARLHQWLRGTFRQHLINFTSYTDDLSLVTARVSAPRLPPVYLVIDAKNLAIRQQLAAYPDLKPEDLAVVEPIELTTRDGLKIRGYLTTPNSPQKKQLPTIVVVHGGPHGVYDVYDYDFEAQLFASRGYAVLQVNYRGSGGRGREFLNAGYQRWGREMQDDITDAVRWAIADGVSDRSRICIYGGSYGAYAALTGAFREPDMFKCAVGMAGVYDLPLMFEKGDIQTVDRGVNYLQRALGTDMEELKRRSPVYNAHQIRAAVMLLHGKTDDRAPFEHAKRMRAALEKAGNPPEWITEWGEAHGFFEENNRAESYERILAFFAKHLGEKAVTAP